MSVETSNRVWKHSQNGGARLLLLLAMADWSDDWGYCHPSIEQMAVKCRQTERNILNLIAELEKAGEVRRVARGKGLTRKELIRIVFGEEPDNNLSNDTRDRKIRKGIESLRNMGIPIVSTSGKAGYRLDTNPENIECMIKEWEGRITCLQHRVDAAKQYFTLFAENFNTKGNDL